ncbi:hypothetical protein [Campylobacter showae]|uniref:hypothetical protein n=1 Tax=Campylobacter showae TaxID=204 RepID=UPI000F074CAD|nr:hypothetical protein [Campylobacter showae]
MQKDILQQREAKYFIDFADHQYLIGDEWKTGDIEVVAEPTPVIAEYIVAIPFSAGEWEEMVDVLDIDVESLDELGSAYAYFEDICEALGLASGCNLEELLQELRARGVKCGDIVRADVDAPEVLEKFGDLMIYCDGDGYGAGWNYLEKTAYMGETADGQVIFGEQYREEL